MGKLHRRLFTGAMIGAAGLGMAVATTAPAAAQGAPQRGGTAIFSIGQDPLTVNPGVSTNPPDRLVGCILYEGLVQVAPDYKIMPLLAKSWTVSPDGLTYSFDLAKAEWHDGKPVTSADVKYSLLEVDSKLSSTFAPAGKVISAIETPAPDKVVIKLKSGFGPFMLSLACGGGGVILPGHLFEGSDPMKNPASSTAAVGTGPFKISEWKRGDYVRLAKNPKYHIEGKPYLDEVVAKVITQASSRLQALQAGEIDLVQFFPGSDQATVRSNPKLKLMTSDNAPGITIATINTTKKPFDDKRIRQALFMGMDRDYLIKNAFFGWGSVGVMPFHSEIAWAADPSIDFNKMYPFDAAKANALLDAAGAKRGADGKRFTVRNLIFATQYPEFKQVSAALKSMYQAIGVDLETEALEDATLFQRIYKDRDFDMTIVSYSSYFDPALGLARAFVTSSIGQVYGNGSIYSNPTVDALFQKAEAGTTNEERGKSYKEVQAILATDLPSLTFRQYRNIDGASQRLQGVWGTVQGNGDWASAWISK